MIFFSILQELHYLPYPCDDSLNLEILCCKAYIYAQKKYTKALALEAVFFVLFQSVEPKSILILLLLNF